MYQLKVFAMGLLATCTIASAQDVLITGHVQRVVLQPSGTENCPPLCPATVTTLPNGMQHVCVTNAGGCQMMEVKVDHDYHGGLPGQIRQFGSRIGEWGPSFSATDQKILVSEEAGRISWSPVTERDGRVFFDPRRIRRIGGVPTSQDSETELVALDELLQRSAIGH